MFTKINNPENGEKVSIFSKLGKDILKKYTLQIKKGGSSWGTVETSTEITKSVDSLSKQEGGWGFTNNPEEE